MSNTGRINQLFKVFYSVSQVRSLVSDKTPEKTNNNEFWGKIFLMQLKTEKKIYIFPLLLHKKTTKF